METHPERAGRLLRCRASVRRSWSLMGRRTWLLALLLMVLLLVESGDAYGRCEVTKPMTRNLPAEKSYVDDRRGICNDKIPKHCLLRPHIIPREEIHILHQTCAHYPEYEATADCGHGPSPPQQLTANITFVSKDLIQILVEWKLPSDYCSLTGYHVAVWRDTMHGLRSGNPCFCFNLGPFDTSILLDSETNPCLGQCLMPDKEYGSRTYVDFEIMSLPSIRVPETDIQSSLKRVMVPGCQELETLPEWCLKFPPAPPKLNITDLRNGSLFIEWTEPYSDPTINITGYILTWRIDEKNFVSPNKRWTFDSSVRSFMTSSGMIEYDTRYVFHVVANSTATGRDYNGNIIRMSDESDHKTAKIESVDGGWSHYSEWSDCAVCHDSSHARRHRNCSNPAPMFNGRPCIGEAEDKVPCNLTKRCLELTTPWVTTVVVAPTSGKADSGDSPFYQRTTFFVTLCIGIACIVIFVTFLCIIYRFHKPSMDKSDAKRSHGRNFIPYITEPGRSPVPTPQPGPTTSEARRFKPVVYISYSRKQDGAELDRVMAFGVWLHKCNVNVVIDRWHENEIAEDIAGWIQRKIETSDFIISICSKAYHQDWMKMGAAASTEDLNSIMREDFEGDRMKRQYLETLLINAQLMRNGCRNSICIPVILSDTLGEKASPRVPNALSNSKIYHITDGCCGDAKELLHRLYGVEQFQGPEIEKSWPELVVSVDSCSVSSTSSTITTTCAEASSFSDIVTDSCSEDSLPR